MGEVLVYFDGAKVPVRSAVAGLAQAGCNIWSIARWLDTAEFDEDGWTTIGGAPDGKGAMHAGGSPVKVKDGTIVAGRVPKDVIGKKVKDAGKALSEKSGKGETGHPELDKALSSAKEPHERIKAVLDNAHHIATVAHSGHDHAIHDKAEGVIRSAFKDTPKALRPALAEKFGIKGAGKSSAVEHVVGKLHEKVAGHMKKSMGDPDKLPHEVRAEARDKLKGDGYKAPKDKKERVAKAAPAKAKGVDHASTAASIDGLVRHAERMGKTGEGRAAATKKLESLGLDKMKSADLDKVAKHLGHEGVAKQKTKAGKLAALKGRVHGALEDAKGGIDLDDTSRVEKRKAAKAAKAERVAKAKAGDKPTAKKPQEKDLAKEDGSYKKLSDDDLKALHASRTKSAAGAKTPGDRKFHQKVADRVHAELQRRSGSTAKEPESKAPAGKAGAVAKLKAAASAKKDIDHKDIASKVHAVGQAAAAHLPKDGETEQESERRARAAGDHRADAKKKLGDLGLDKMSEADLDKVAKHLGHSDKDISERETKEDKIKGIRMHAMREWNKAQTAKFRGRPRLTKSP